VVSRVMVLTLGFDEKFAIRALTRAAPSSGDEVLVVMPSESDERVEKALDYLRRFCNIMDFPLEVEKVPVEKPEEAIAMIYKRLSQRLRGGKKLYLNLSGGMRALVLEVLAAAIAIARQWPSSMVETKVEVELENFKNVIELTLGHFSLSLPGSIDLEVLRSIKKLQASGEATLDTIASEAKIPRSTTYRRLLDLKERGYVRAEKRGRKVVYSLTELGEMWA